MSASQLNDQLQPATEASEQPDEQREAYRCESLGMAMVNIGRRVIHGKIVNESAVGLLIELDGVYRLTIGSLVRVRTNSGAFHARVVRTEMIGKRRMQFAVERTEEIPSKLKQRFLWGGLLHNDGMQKRNWYESVIRAGIFLTVGLLALLFLWVIVWDGDPAKLLRR